LRLITSDSLYRPASSSDQLPVYGTPSEEQGPQSPASTLPQGEADGVRSAEVGLGTRGRVAWTDVSGSCIQYDASVVRYHRESSEAAKRHGARVGLAVGGLSTVRVRIPAPLLFRNLQESAISAYNGSVRLTEAEIVRVLDQRLVIGGEIKWVSSREHPDFVKAELRVAHELEGELAVVLTANVVLSRKFTYNLFYRKERVKSLHVNGPPHRNSGRDRQRFRRCETHKHVLTDDCDMSWAYAPDDITTDEPHQAFLQFCQECRIQFDGLWNPIPKAPLGGADRPLGI